MRAVVFEEFGQAPSIRTVPDPRPAPEGVVIKLEATGICRSDWHGWMGHDPDIRLPHVPGHELAGTVVAVGRQVSRWKAGDRVTVPFVAGCGRCFECTSGNHQVCEHQFQPGFTAWGSFAEYVAIDFADTNLVRLPESMDFATAASLGCRFVTSFRAVVDQGRVTPGEWVAVHGCGGVGLSALLGAIACGASRVVAVDLNGSPPTRWDTPVRDVEARHPEPEPGLLGRWMERHVGPSGAQHTHHLSLVEVMARALDTMQERITHVQLALDPPDLLIQIPRDACQFYEFWRAAELIDIGRREAEKALAAAGF